MAEEVLNRNIQKLLTYKQCSPNYGRRQASPPCHLLFADDLLIFAKATLKGSSRTRKSPFQILQFRRPYWNGALNNLKCNLFFCHLPIDRRKKRKEIFDLLEMKFSPKSLLGSLFFRDNQRKIILVTLLKPSTKVEI